jgi:hypothetical protein
VTIDTSKILSNPKSTAVGACGLVIAVTMAWMALPPKASIPVTVIAIARALIQFFSDDAGKTLAKLPGSTSPQLVDSHETPDDPQAVPVVKQ